MLLLIHLLLPPRPLLIKCANAWDRRFLLGSRRKLKDFTKYKLFLREDLPPDERHTVSALLVLMALSITLILLLFLLRLLPLIPPTLLQFLVLIVFQFFRFTPDLLWLLPIIHKSALIIVVGGILVNNMFQSYLNYMHDLCLIQEHWLFHDHLNSLNFSNDVLSVAVSGMDDTDLILGRPFGGCGIIYCKSLSPFIRRIYSPSKRFCAVSVTLHNTCDHSNVNLLICVYLPTDYGTEYSDALFVEAIGELGFIQCTS